MAIGTFIRDSLNKLAARVTYARNGVSALSIKIEDMNVDGFSLPVVDGAFGIPYSDYLRNSSDSIEQIVNGSVTPVEFTFPAQSSDMLISSITIVAQEGSMKYLNYLGENSTLTNGVLIEVKANNVVTTFNTIKSTADYVAWATPGQFFRGSDAGGDVINASRSDGFLLKATGTFGPAANDDYIKITIQDNLTGVVQQRGIVSGRLI